MSVEPSRLGTERAQAEAIQRLRGGPAAAPSREQDSDYAGLVTRTIAFTLDAIVVIGSVALVGVTIGLSLSLLHLPSEVDKVIAAVVGVLALVWPAAYFAFFWSTTGQTPGSRVMSITVLDARRRGPLNPRRALLRFLALWVGALALLSGLLVMLWDDRRRCFQDRVARTIVVYLASDPEE